MKNILFLTIVVLLWSCSSNTEKEKRNINPTKALTPLIDNLVKFSDEQLKVAGIKIGVLDSVRMSEEVYCTGIVEASPQNIAKVSVPTSAFIDEIFVKHGNFVNKGTVILSFKHNDFIDLQSNYLKLKSELDYKLEEFERQKKLFEEKAISKKKYRQVELDYKMTLTEQKALEQKLILLGLQPSVLTPENINSTIQLKAPIAGYIDEIYVTTGEFVEPKDVLFEMINPTDFNIMLDVYAKYKNLLKIGDRVMFRPCDHCEPNYAEIYSVGQIIDGNSKTLKVHATPTNNKLNLTSGAFINAKILINDSYVKALPTSAIITNQEGSFVFVDKSNNTFELIKVNIGNSNDTFVQIINFEDIKDFSVVVQGANYLFTKLKS